MKHILPILTLALLGAAVTASADNFYYEYYDEPGYTTPTTITGKYYAHYDTDSYSYGDPDSRDFQVVRNSQNGNYLTDAAKSNFYRIHVIGNDVDLYLTDYVDNIGDNNTNDNFSALYNRITEYGYRKLTQDANGMYVPAAADPTDENDFNQDGTAKYTITSNDGIPTITNEKGESSVARAIDTIEFAGTPVDRFQYHLGTFKSGDVIELYMNDALIENNPGVYSYTDFNITDVNGNPGAAAAQGGFGDGGYVVYEETDAMLNSYYFQEYLNEEKNDGFVNYTNFDDTVTSAAQKAMPLSTLVPSPKNGVYFGIYATAAGNIDVNVDDTVGSAGSPLPGGLQIALIAGLFGLGFWYIRRKKAVAA